MRRAKQIDSSEASLGWRLHRLAKYSAAVLAIVFAALGAVTLATGTASAQTPPSLTIVTEASSDPAQNFRYWLSGPGMLEEIEQSHGESVTIPLVAGQLVNVLQVDEQGWITEFDCTNGSTGTHVAGSWDTSFTLSSGAQASCTYSNRSAGSASLAVVFAENVDVDAQLEFIDRMTGQVVTIRDGEEWTATVPAWTDIEITDTNLDSPDLVVEGFCGGANADVVADQYGISGRLAAGDAVTCTLSAALRPGLQVSSSCLQGNGRIDVNIASDSTEPVEYRVGFGNISRRVVVQPGDWGRNSITGRPEGPIRVTIQRNGEITAVGTYNVECDTPEPVVSSPEIQVLNTCRATNGFVLWQFVNPTDEARGYVIGFGDRPNRSTTAQPYGAAVRGISGRPNGTYDYWVRANGVLIEESSVTVACD